jgi:hypothetical protein
VKVLGALAAGLVVLLLSLGDAAAGYGEGATPSPEEQLAARHAPILLISVLTNCYADGGYDPVPVELVHTSLGKKA